MVDRRASYSLRSFRQTYDIVDIRRSPRHRIESRKCLAITVTLLPEVRAPTSTHERPFGSVAAERALRQPPARTVVIIKSIFLACSRRHFVEDRHAPPRPPGSPKNHAQNGQVGELSENDEQELAGELRCRRPSRGADVKQHDIVDNECVA